MEKEKTMDEAFQLYKIHRACVRGQTLQEVDHPIAVTKKREPSGKQVDNTS